MQSDLASVDFLMKLAGALHRYGMPAHRLEGALVRVGRQLEIEGSFMAAPTSVIASLGPPASAQTVMLRCPPGKVNLGKQAELHDLIRDVCGARVGIDEAVEVLDGLGERPGLAVQFAQAAAFSLASAGAAVFFDGGQAELISAAVIGAVIGLMVQLAARSRRLMVVLPGAAGLAAVLVNAALSELVGPAVPFIATVAGLIILIPGLNLTVAVNELAHAHLVSGTARLGGALIALVQVAFGVTLGHKLTAGLTVTAPTTPDPLPLVAFVPALLVTALASSVLFRVRPRDSPIVLLTLAVAFSSSRLATHAFGPELGVLLGAWLMGTVAHLVARWRDVPSAVGILPGILPLLPGGLGFRTVTSLLDADVVGSLDTGVTMLWVALSLVTGLLLSTVTARARDAF